MKHLAYSLLIRSSFLAVRVASLFHWKAKRFVNYRRNWANKLKEQLDPKLKRILLICPSIGEFQECRKFVNRLAKEKEGYQLVYAFFSPSGFDQAKIAGVNAVRMMLPLDSRKNARTLFDIVAPEEVFILATGIWPFVIMEMQKRKIPHYMVSFYYRKDSSFFHPALKGFFKPLFSSFELISCYRDECREMLASEYGFTKTVTSGNLRFDCVIEMKESLREVTIAREFADGKFCLVAGSTETKEDELLEKAFKRLRHLDMKWIIVPHEKLPPTLQRLKRMFGDDACFSSKDFDPSKKVLIYDTTGDLFQLYQYSQLTLVGRGFHRLEIHNMLEPAVFWKPVLIGPKHKKFVEPKAFIERKLAFEFNDENELASLIERFFTGELSINIEDLKEMFAKGSGGTEVIFDYINSKD